MNSKKTTYSAILGTLIANERKAQQLEQFAVAEKMGLSQASYSRMESGRATLTLEHMFQAGAALGFSEAEFSDKLVKLIESFKENGIEIVNVQRGNSNGAQNKEAVTSGSDKANGNGKLLVGAALGALAFSILSNR